MGSRLNVNVYKGDPLIQTKSVRSQIFSGFANVKISIYKDHAYKHYFAIKVKFFGPLRQLGRLESLNFKTRVKKGS